jgi:hypothetical protein
MVLSGSLAYCNPPKDIVVNITKDIVDVSVIHPSADPADHYIKTIKISVNGVLFKEQSFTQQTGNEQDASYQIPGLKKFDKVTVQAFCSKFGALTREKDVE